MTETIADGAQPVAGSPLNLPALMHPRRSIAARVMLLVTIGTLTTLALLGHASWSAMRRVEASVARDHLAVATVAARDMDEKLAGLLSELQSLANDARAFEPFRQHPAEVEDRALAAWRTAAGLDSLFLAALDGILIAHAPAGPGPRREVVLEAADRMSRTPRPLITPSVAGPAVGRRVLLLVPLRTWRGDLLGVVAGQVDVAGRRFAQLAVPLAAAPMGHLDLLDEREEVLFAGRGHAAEGHLSPPLATATLTLAPWRVISYRSDDATAATDYVRRRLLWMGPLLAAGTLLLAWGTAWSVRRPLLTLTRAAERLAAGDLATPLTVRGRDELGHLGRAFENMRRALLQSRTETESANAELEARVERRTQELARLNQELRDRERARQSLLRKIVTAQEDERKRIARELHDEACQTVTALGLHLDTTLARTPLTSGAFESLTRARELATRSLDELRRLMHDLRPALLDDLGLVAAVRSSVERLTRRGIAVRFETSVMTLSLPVEVEIAVFRAVQEALTNIERHARADMVLVQMIIAADVCTVDIEDDGEGFDPESVAVTPDHGRGLGLLGMRERLELVGGNLLIRSKRGQGTQVTIQAPCQQE